MKNQVQNENEIREYLLFSEYEMSDIDYDVTFDIVDIDFFYETITLLKNTLISVVFLDDVSFPKVFCYLANQYKQV